MPTKTAKVPPFRTIPRSAWRARKPKAGMAQQRDPTEAFIHYSDDASADQVHGLALAESVVRGIQSFHMDGRGWDDIAYHWVLVQDATVPWTEKAGGLTYAFAGRAAGYVPAAQLGHNTGTIAICVHAGPATLISPRTRYVIERLLAQEPSLRTLGWHGQVTSTDCPGSELRALVPNLAKVAGLKLFKPASK